MVNYIKIFEKESGLTWDRKKFHVHHIDMNRQNNSIRNLLLMPNIMHNRFHWMQSEIQRTTEIIFKPGELSYFGWSNLVEEYSIIKSDMYWLFRIEQDYINLKDKQLFEMLSERLENLSIKYKKDKK